VHTWVLKMVHSHNRNMGTAHSTVVLCRPRVYAREPPRGDGVMLMGRAQAKAKGSRPLRRLPTSLIRTDHIRWSARERQALLDGPWGSPARRRTHGNTTGNTTPSCHAPPSVTTRVHPAMGSALADVLVIVSSMQ